MTGSLMAWRVAMVMWLDVVWWEGLVFALGMFIGEQRSDGVVWLSRQSHTPKVPGSSPGLVLVDILYDMWSLSFLSVWVLWLTRGGIVCLVCSRPSGLLSIRREKG